MHPTEQPGSGRDIPTALKSREELRRQFWAAIESQSSDPIELLPTSLAGAAAKVLNVAGIGLSVANDRFRVPLGASDDEAVAAERLQFTIGEGPCLSAMHTHTEIRVSGSDMNRRWPAFYEQLASRSSYRSIASVPFRAATDVNAAMDLYFRDDTGAFSTDLEDATAIAELIALALRATATPAVPSVLDRDAMLPPWLHGPAARNRLRTWIATGVLMTHFGADAAAALTRLRAWAYASGLTVDDATDLVINGDLKPEELA
jgi:hypothetical protein